MSERQPAHALEEVAQKWRALAERRRAYFLELYRSGRWKYYYKTEAQFSLRLREVNTAVDTWTAIIDPAVVELPKDELIVPRRKNAA